MNKLLRMVKSDKGDYGDILSGFYSPSEDTICINVQFIWGVTGSYNKFVKYYSKVFEHETIHRLIHYELGKKRRTELAEDTVVRKLTHEQMRRQFKKYYARQDRRKK